MTQKTSEKQLHHTHITAKRRRFELNLKEVWQYRDLIALFTKRSFTLKYKQTVLGPVWIFLNPLISSLIYAFVFGGIAGIGTDGVPPMLFYLCSNAIWIFFSSCVNQNAATFTGNAGVFGKVYFPRLTIPISNVLSSVIQFGIQMLLLLGFMVFYLIQGELNPNWAWWALVPLALVHLGILGMSVGIVVSSLTTKYRDLSILITFGVSLWMYLTPIVYPISSVGEGIMKKVFMLNPVTPAAELIRYAVLGQGTIHWGYYGASAGVTLVLFVIGVMIFNRVEKTFMDTV